MSSLSPLINFPTVGSFGKAVQSSTRNIPCASTEGGRQPSIPQKQKHCSPAVPMCYIFRDYITIVLPVFSLWFFGTFGASKGSAALEGGAGGQPAQPQYANYWALTCKRHIPPHPAQPRHTNYWAPRTRKRHQQEHRPQRPTESSNPTQHAKGRAGDCPGPRNETTTRRNVTQGGAVKTAAWRTFRRRSTLHHAVKNKRVTVQGSVTKPQMDYMSHRGGGALGGLSWYPYAAVFGSPSSYVHMSGASALPPQPWLWLLPHV